MSYMRPICINPGCGSLAVPMRGRVGDPDVRYRVYCDPCHRSNYKKTPLREGVTPYRTGVCSNHDGALLGFPCVVDWKLAKRSNFDISTEVDHINGDCHDNDPKNLQELCPICHKEKGKRNGDHNGWR